VGWVLFIRYTSRGEQAAVVGVSAGLAGLPRRLQRLSIVGLIAFAGSVILLIANPFADALLAVGASAGFEPYVLIQSAVPLATEAPEFVVVSVLIANHRPAQGLALFLSAAVSQWTVAFGALPLAYSAGGGGLLLPLAAREQLELGFTIAITLFAVAALCPLRIMRQDAVLVAAVFFLQLVYPSPFMRLAASFVLLVFAIDLLVAHRRFLGPCLRSLWTRA
jgi:cation:H+ antiporter